MADFLTASLVLALLVFSFSVSADQITSNAKRGDNATLTCREAENRNFVAAEWKKTNQSICLYWINEFEENKPVCSNSRADLLDVKNGNVSLVLKNVKTDDTGTYECWIKETTNNRRKRSVQGYKPICIVDLRVEPDQRITAEPGDNVILTCRAAENEDVIVVKWNRTDLGSGQFVLQYKDSQSDPEIQSPSFRDRVSLLDVKNGDVSLVLKNVKTDDTGTYECRVVQGGNNRRKRSILDTEPISIINLRVKPGNEDGGNKTGLIAGVSVCAVALVVVAAVFYKKSRYSSLKSKCPPAVAAAVIGEATLKELLE